MRIRDEDGVEEAEFSMAPMIDVVFQLLIFFMVSTTYATQEKELGVELPTARSGESAGGAPQEMVINVFRDGRVTLDGRAVEQGELDRVLAEAARANRATQVTIRGDRLTSHERIVSVMDACGVAGLSNLALGTRD
ncbi:MAG: biopolymer transporter ExbD [Planctomycetes bacterium]|jgi:biopolymer transport protein ExbD|nr:biopolymer transporter ExbD [Planctomycetota bacterium]